MTLLFDPFQPLVGGLARPAAAFVPDADVAVSDHDMVITLDVPGLRQEDLSIEVVDQQLIVRGSRRRPDVERAAYAHHERAFGDFERRFRMPDAIDAAGITATLDDGVLSLMVPKPERMKPRRIEIGATEAPTRELAVGG